MDIKRIIPCLDLRQGRVVKGVSFVDIADAGDPVEFAKYYCERGADELTILDIDATVEGRKTMPGIVEKVAAAISIPLAVGGGVYTAEDFGRLLRAGASKVSLNSAAVKRPELISEAAGKFGSECVICAIDVARNGGRFEVYTAGGKVKSGLDAVEWAKEAQRRGAGEILLTSIDEDGRKNGYDIEITALISKSVDIPVTASGGAGEKRHFLEAFTKGGAAAALAASLFHFREIDIMELKRYLKENGIPVNI